MQKAYYQQLIRYACGDCGAYPNEPCIYMHNHYNYYMGRVGDHIPDWVHHDRSRYLWELRKREKQQSDIRKLEDWLRANGHIFTDLA